MHTAFTQHVTIRVPIDDEELHGDLAIPENAKGLVLFAHGSGSSRHSPRNQFVAEELQNSRFATFLLDLLTEKEERIDNLTRHLRFNIPFLSRRLIAAAAWVKTVSEVYKLNIGLFGASTGGAAALLAASQRPDLFRAIVSRGGRPDLAAEALESVKTPTLLIVGELDSQVLLLNQYALRLLTSEKKLEIVRGATHLFEEPGKLEVVASHAAEWFDEYL
jgi:pimeloyl-ACP methyl ester carboxylesterase